MLWPNECDGQEHGGGDESGHAEKAAVDVEVWKRLAPMMPSTRLRRLNDSAQRVDCQGWCCRSRYSSLSATVTVLPHPQDSPGAQLVVGMVCGIRIEAGVLVQRARAKLSTSQFWNCSRRVTS